MYIWSYEDNEQLNNIKNITKSIDSLYTQLCDLEINNKKNTEQYHKLLNHLSIALEIEQKRYNDCNLNLEKTNKWLNYLYYNGINNPWLTNVDSITLMNYQQGVLRRIINKLRGYLIFDNSKLENEWINVLINDKNYQIKDAKNIINKVSSLIEKDILNVYMYYLNQEISLTPDKEKEKFIYNKYYTSFIFSYLEKNFIDNKFNCDDNLYLESQLVADTFKISSPLYDSIRDRYCFEVTQYNINDLIHIKNLSDKNIDSFITVTLKYLFIQSGLKIASHKFVDRRKKAFLKFMNQSSERSNREGVLLTLNCFIKNEKERSNIYTLSLKKDNNS